MFFLKPMSLLTLVAVLALNMGQALAQNHATNPYDTIEGVWGKFPSERKWGSTSAVAVGPDGTIWVAERCGANNCNEIHDVPPVLAFNSAGELQRSFGAGMIIQPHGMDVDSQGNVWVTDTGKNDSIGYQVIKFSPDGEVMMKIGTATGKGDGPDSFNGPSDVQIAPNGDIFVAVGHLGRGDDNRIAKFSSDGTFIKSWGKTGKGINEFHDPHALAMDSQGRLYVGDRYNNRIQIYSQDGEYIATWTQFGRPSGLYIDRNDYLYSADSESNTRRNPGWKRGIRIGSVRDGWVVAFIPDTEPMPDGSATSGAEGVAVDRRGNIYGAEVGPRMLRKYVRR